MTNFERWKQSLTPEDIFTNYGIFEFCGKTCPATEYCKEHKGKEWLSFYTLKPPFQFPFELRRTCWRYQKI